MRVKAIGRHPDRALSAVRIRNLKTPGRYADGNGLYLFVDVTGAKRWVLRTMVHGRRRDMGREYRGCGFALRSERDPDVCQCPSRPSSISSHIRCGM